MSSLRYTSVGVMRPPKPPCWRDFVSSSPKSIHSEGAEILESSGRTLGARSPVADLLETSRVSVSLTGNKLSRLARRPRARIHRTRSEHIIRTEDLPDSAFTATLAEADPKGLRVRVPDGRLYVEENNRRCQNWLAGVEAAEPLDEVGYTVERQPLSTQAQETPHVQTLKADSTKFEDPKSSKLPEKDSIPVYDLRQSVDIEIPEETFVWGTWSKEQSASSDEEISGTFKVISQDDCDNTSGNHLLSSTDSATHSPEFLARNRTLDTTQAADNVAQGETAKGDNSYKTNSSNFSNTAMHCDKPTNGKSCQKLHSCCDDTDSSSGTDNSSQCRLVSEQRHENRLKYVGTKEGRVTDKDSNMSMIPDKSRSLSNRVPSDSELN